MSRSTTRHSTRSPSQFDSGVKRVLRHVEKAAQRLIQLPLQLFVRPRALTKPIPVDELRSVLILRHDAIGDAVLTTPIWRSLKRAAPDITIGVAGSPQNREFLELDADVDHVYTIERKLSRKVIAELRRARQINYDLVLNLQFHDKSRGALFASIAAPHAWTGTGVSRVGTKYEQLYSSAVILTDAKRPITEQYLEVLQSLVVLPQSDPYPSLQLREALPSNDSSRRYVIIHTDCSQTYKDWGLANFVTLAQQLVTTHEGLHVYLTSGPSKADAVLDAIREVSHSDIEHVSTPRLTDLLGLSKASTLVISPDTSIVHFAGALGRPVVGLYLEPSPFLPYSDSTSRVVFAPPGKGVADIPIPHVVAAVRDLLETVKGE